MIPVPGPVRPRPLRLGTRGSILARIQSELVADALRQAGHEVELAVVVTAGDVRAPDTAWGEGAFVGALERALLAGDVDLAVHSAKDVPIGGDAEGRAPVPAGLVIAAYPWREDPRDALVLPSSRTVPSPASGDPAACTDPVLPLARGARVGTDSPRRVGFLHAIRPDLAFVALHGNVDTRLRRLDAGEADALLLAAAGLIRLGHRARISCLVDPAIVPPAPAQGALAVQCRADDRYVRATLEALDDPDVRLAVETEREVLRGAGGGCRAPLGALATVSAGQVDLLAGAIGTGRSPCIARSSAPADRWRELAAGASRSLLRAGFREIEA